MKEIGVFINPAARDDTRDKAFNFAVKSQSPVTFLSFPFKDTETCNTFVVVGGDGSQKGVVEQLIKSERSCDANVLVVPGGSVNGLYKAASQSGALATSEQILSGDYSALQKFRPGNVDGELFNHGVSFGKHALNLEKIDNKLRGAMPRFMRTNTAAVIEIIRGTIKDDVSGTLAKIIITGSNLGTLKLFPTGDMFSDDLGYISLEGGTRRQVAVRGAIAFYCIARGIGIPESVAEYKRFESMELTLLGDDQAMNADGQIRRAAQEKVLVTRSAKSVNLAAFKL